VSRRPTPEENGQALVRVLDALDEIRKAYYRACRHDEAALVHVHAAGEQLHEVALCCAAASRRRIGSGPTDLHDLRRVDE
jgi:hypothetical protein